MCILNLWAETMSSDSCPASKEKPGFSVLWFQNCVYICFRILQIEVL